MHQYCELAFRTIKNYLETGAVMSLPKDVPNELKTIKAGAFVSIHLKKGVLHSQNGSNYGARNASRPSAAGDLRGCIGTFLPTCNCLGEEIIQNAISAAFDDPRFMPISKTELSNLDISVDVLAEPQECKIEDLNPKKYGVIVAYKGRRGLLLPDLEGVDTVKEQIEIACRKAGIDFANEKFVVSKFVVERYH